MREKDAPPDQYRELIKDSILDEATFVQAVFGGRRRGHAVPWNRVVIRPVLIRDKRRIQFSYFEATKDITKNYIGDEVVDKVNELLALPFKSISLQTIEHDIQVQITNKGKVIIHQHKAIYLTDGSCSKFLFKLCKSIIILFLNDFLSIFLYLLVKTIISDLFKNLSKSSIIKFSR